MVERALGNIMPGTTWIQTSDSFGISYICSECGHNEFYRDKVPEPCEHKPEAYEIAMHKDRMDRQKNKSIRI